MTTNQPTNMIARAGRMSPGFVKTATMTGGVQDTNGPKKGIAMRIPAAAVVTPMSGSPRIALVAEGDDPVGEADHRLSPEEPAERLRDGRLQEVELLASAGRDEAVHERPDAVLVDDDVDGQDDDDEDGPHRTQAGDRDRLERAHDRRRVVAQEPEGLLGGVDHVDLAEAERLEPILERLEDARQVVDEPRDVGDEVGDRLGQRAGHEDDRPDHHRQQDDVDDRRPRPPAAAPG